MSRTTSITIGDPLDSFIDRMLKSGRYGSTSELVRSALRRDDFQKHAIFYRVRETDIFVIRILHQQMNAMLHL